jgi:hypothetical protein
MRRKSGYLDVQPVGMSLIGSYGAGMQVECNNIGSAGYDRCGDGVQSWQNAQQEAIVAIWSVALWAPIVHLCMTLTNS